MENHLPTPFVASLFDALYLRVDREYPIEVVRGFVVNLTRHFLEQGAESEHAYFVVRQ